MLTCEDPHTGPRPPRSRKPMMPPWLCHTAYFIGTAVVNRYPPAQRRNRLLPCKPFRELAVTTGSTYKSTGAGICTNLALRARGLAQRSGIIAAQQRSNIAIYRHRTRKRAQYVAIIPYPNVGDDVHMVPRPPRARRLMLPTPTSTARNSVILLSKRR
jgi:hypothetical protein